MILSAGRGLYAVYSKAGKRLSKPTGKAGAERRLRQVEHFKHAKGRR